MTAAENFSERGFISVAPLCDNDFRVLLKNPDRGLRMESYITLGERLRAYPDSEEDPFERIKERLLRFKDDSPTICQLYVYLTDFANRAITPQAFSQLEKMLRLLLESRVKALLRFAYATESSPDAPYSTVKLHLRQIDGFFKENAELIRETLYCLQTGIIGFWGEGHSNKRLKNRHIKAVINGVADIAPEGVFTQVRTEKMLSLVRKENLYRVGIHDDYIIGDMSHKWSFVSNEDKKSFALVTNHAKATVNDGELPWGRARLDDKPDAQPLSSLDACNIIEQLKSYSITSFSLEHNYIEDGCEYSMVKWKKQKLPLRRLREIGVESCFAGEMSAFDFISLHLGYLLRLESYAQDGARAKVKIKNFGFAAPHNIRYLAFAAEDIKSGQIELIKVKAYEPSALISGKTVTAEQALPEGFRIVGVCAKPYEDSVYGVRFANNAPFKDNIQYLNKKGERES